MTRMVAWAAIGLLVGLGAAGCSVRANANLNAGGKAQADFDEPLPEDESAVAGFREGDDETEDFALLGARHDLALSDAASQQAKCDCLAAALGGPTDPSFVWAANAPKVQPDTQLVVALSSKRVKCAEEAPAESLGASYWGYKRSGEDIVVIVENATAGRPLTSGAVIPKPSANGQVLVRPAHKKVPFGRPLGTDKVCKLGNPGPVRTLDSTTPPSEDSEDTPEFTD